MRKPVISIILPIYNIEKYLDKCMDSIINQTYKNLEIIMVDDGSTDGCGVKCDGFLKQDRRVVVYHKTNGGLSDARNYGISRANGEYIACIDPDDYVDLDYIEYLFDILMKYNSRMSICQHRVRYSNGTVKDYGKNGDEALSAKCCVERLLYHDVIDTSAWAKLYHKSLFEKVQYPKGRIFEDIGTTYALMLQCDYIAVGYQSKYNYIFHDNSVVNSEFKPNKLDLLEMTDIMGKNVEKIFPDLSEAVLRRRVYSRISTLNQMLTISNYEKEKKDILEFIRKNRGKVLKNNKAPIRDKIALIMLTFSYSFYKFCWLLYRNQKMKTK